MSRIYFHTKSRDAEVHGSERVYFGGLCGAMLLVPLEGFLYEWSERPATIRRILPKDDYVQNATYDNFEYAARRSLQYGMVGTTFLIDDIKVPAWVAALNTALAMGNDAVKLAARLHGQCEIHAYVEDENRGWLSSIISKGLKTGIYRKNQGWLEVLSLLAECDGPYVTSYSVCEQFPRPGVIESWGTCECEIERFYELDSTEQWELAIEALRKKPKMEISPSNWDDYFFRDGWDGFKIAAHLDKLEAESGAQ